VVNVPPYDTVVGDDGAKPEPPVPAAYEIVCEFAVHTAYNVTFVVMVNVLAAACDVPPQAAPAAGCVVHQPSNLYPVRASDPVLSSTLTDALLAYAVASVGAVPDVGELPL